MAFLAPLFGGGVFAGTALARLASLGGFGTLALRLGAALLLSAASRALMPGPTLPARTVTVREAVAPRDMVYGRARKGGVIIYISEAGPKRQYLHLVVVLAAHRVAGIGAVYFDGEAAVDASGVALGRWAGLVTVEKRLGTDDQTGFDGLIAALPEAWTTAHRLRGCAAIHLRLQADQDAFPGGIPAISVDVQGKNDIYDPRSDTFAYSENPALCLADYMAHARFGLGAAIGASDGINTEALIEAANICDEAVSLAAGGSELRYSCNGVVSLAENPKTIIEAMLTAMAGRVANSGGQWRLHAGAYRMPTFGLTQDHAREGGLTLSTRISAAQNFNGVRGQFISPENDWQPDDFPAYVSEVYRSEDGGEEKWRDIALPFTQSATTAQRLAKIELERARRQMSIRFAGKLSAWAVQVGDTVALTYDRWGMAAKPYEVIEARLDLATSGDGPQLLPELVLRETSPLVYDWDASEAAIYAAAPRSTLPSAFNVAPPGSPEIAESLYITRDGAGVKAAVLVSWRASDSGYVAQYQVESRMVDSLGSALGSGAWTNHGRTDATAMEIRDIAPGFWEVRVKALTVLGGGGGNKQGGHRRNRKGNPRYRPGVRGVPRQGADGSWGVFALVGHGEGGAGSDSPTCCARGGDAANRRRHGNPEMDAVCRSRCAYRRQYRDPTQSGPECDLGQQPVLRHRGGQRCHRGGATSSRHLPFSRPPQFRGAGRGCLAFHHWRASAGLCPGDGPDGRARF